jgi:hypothetical protein
VALYRCETWSLRLREEHRLRVSDIVGHWWEIQKRPLVRPRRRWVDNIKMNLREIGWDGMDCFDVAQDGDQWRGSCEHSNEHSGSIKRWEVLV